MEVCLQMDCRTVAIRKGWPSVPRKGEKVWVYPSEQMPGGYETVESVEWFNDHVRVILKPR